MKIIRIFKNINITNVKKIEMARRPRFELGKGITPNGISSPAPYQAGPPPHLNPIY